jgi:hypothetical protein
VITGERCLCRPVNKAAAVATSPAALTIAATIRAEENCALVGRAPTAAMR